MKLDSWKKCEEKVPPVLFNYFLADTKCNDELLMYWKISVKGNLRSFIIIILLFMEKLIGLLEIID